ncbi:unnamed protein product [Moneuplotes crassus]|uniref:Uncharacterized protein n=1 Tax=Euplotes crassus TaxID=5936 RepID=A0AAD1UGD6_EUPCR|nr:unnamed protein product [Moneuplotes crassus]
MINKTKRSLSSPKPKIKPKYMPNANLSLAKNRKKSRKKFKLAIKELISTQNTQITSLKNKITTSRLFLLTKSRDLKKLIDCKLSSNIRPQNPKNSQNIHSKPQASPISSPRPAGRNFSCEVADQRPRTQRKFVRAKISPSPKPFFGLTRNLPSRKSQRVKESKTKVNRSLFIHRKSSTGKDLSERQKNSWMKSDTKRKNHKPGTNRYSYQSKEAYNNISNTRYY